MPRQIALFFCALQFLTRIPTPHLAEFRSDWTTRASRYFPLVGQIVGSLAGLALWLAAKVWPEPIPAITALAVGILLTGAFHEDGLADTADGLGGGQDSASRLSIMKDSRIGTYGMLAAGLTLAFKVAALSVMGPAQAALALFAAHGAGRAAAVVVMRTTPYAGDRTDAKWKPDPAGLTMGELATALAIAAWPLVLILQSAAIVGVLSGVALAGGVVLLAKRLIGGHTGDVLGAVEQMFELGFLLGVSALR